MNDDIWWVEVQENGTPYMPCKKPIASKQRPPRGNFAGPYHCRACALSIVNFGRTVKSAYQYEHGTSDQKFGVFLNDGG